MKTKHRWIVIAALTALAGCGRKHLTPTMLEEADKPILRSQPYEPAYKGLVEKLGDPQRNENNWAYWYAMGDGKCVEYSIEKSGDEVGGHTFMKFSPDFKEKYARCL